LAAIGDISRLSRERHPINLRNAIRPKKRRTFAISAQCENVGAENPFRQ